MRANAKEITVQTGSLFASALVSGKYAEARSFLTSELQKTYSPEDLSEKYKAMIEYGDGPAVVDGHHEFLDAWQARLTSDIGWAYISISGSGYSEAVTVVVSDEGGLPKIREIEWGRP